MTERPASHDDVAAHFAAGVDLEPLRRTQRRVAPFQRRRLRGARRRGRDCRRVGVALCAADARHRAPAAASEIVLRISTLVENGRGVHVVRRPESPAAASGDTGSDDRSSGGAPPRPRCRSAIDSAREISTRSYSSSVSLKEWSSDAGSGRRRVAATRGAFDRKHRRDVALRRPCGRRAGSPVARRCSPARERCRASACRVSAAIAPSVHAGARLARAHAVQRGEMRARAPECRPAARAAAESRSESR